MPRRIGAYSFTLHVLFFQYLNYVCSAYDAHKQWKLINNQILCSRYSVKLPFISNITFWILSKFFIKYYCSKKKSYIKLVSFGHIFNNCFKMIKLIFWLQEIVTIFIFLFSLYSSVLDNNQHSILHSSFIFLVF